MTNEQFYILVGVPILGILMNTLVFLSLNARMSAVESRMSALELRMTNFENTFTTRFDLLMGRLMDLEKEIHKGGE
jgi:hypothetical protein